MSWWMCPREEFYEKARAEQSRMAVSRFGRLETLAQGPATHQWRPTTKQKETFGEDWWG